MSDKSQTTAIQGAAIAAAGQLKTLREVAIAKRTPGLNRMAHQTAIMVMQCLLGEFSDQMHPNMKRDVIYAIDGSRAALKEVSHDD